MVQSSFNHLGECIAPLGRVLTHTVATDITTSPPHTPSSTHTETAASFTSQRRSFARCAAQIVLARLWPTRIYCISHPSPSSSVPSRSSARISRARPSHGRRYNTQSHSGRLIMKEGRRTLALQAQSINSQ
ncbi:hypothetical protein HGRIS_005950 [Hohenbuehelia grisea]|uniref:Uncharacterized protein n=1 Tax=Hohenbuehelia grisea TaxID=104357 RepID=A0ABR3JYC1_9AGAR